MNNPYCGAASGLDQASADAFGPAYDVTVVASFHWVTEARPRLRHAVRETGHTAVVNDSSRYGTLSPNPSMYGDSGIDNPPYYGAAKAGLIQLTRYLAVYMATEGIRGMPEELAGTILFLSSDGASYVTGADLAVDGGWRAW